MPSEPRIFDPGDYDDDSPHVELPEVELTDEAWETAALPDDLLLLGDQLRCDAQRLHESHRADRVQRELLQPERAQRAELAASPRGPSPLRALLWMLPVVLVTAALVWNGRPASPPTPVSPHVAATPNAAPQVDFSPNIHQVSLPAQQGPNAAELDALLDLMQHDAASVAVSL